MKKPKYDYLKYWRLVRYYVKAKHNLSFSELDMILFLYSEGYFSKYTFEGFDGVLSWDKYRFKKMLEAGWIIPFRKAEHRSKALFELSQKSILLCQYVYEKLNGSELPTSSAHNPLFKKNVKFSDKTHRNMMLKMNAEIKQRRRPSPEQE